MKPANAAVIAFGFSLGVIALLAQAPRTVAAQAPPPVPCRAIVWAEGSGGWCYPPLPTTTTTTTLPPACVPERDRGVVVDKCAHPMTAAPELAQGESRIDKELGGKVTRLTMVPKSRGANAISKPVYPTMPGFVTINGAQYALYWTREDGWYLAETVAPHRTVKRLDLWEEARSGQPGGGPSDIEHLWPFGDKIRWVTRFGVIKRADGSVEKSNQQMVLEMDILTGAKRVVLNLTSAGCVYDLSLGNDPGPPSSDGSIIGLECYGTVNPAACPGAISGQPNQVVKMSVDLKASKVLGCRVRSSTPNAPNVTHSGKRFYFDGESWNQAFTEFFSMGLPVTHEHSSNVTLADGSEWYVAPDFSNSGIRGNLVMTSLDTPGVARRVVLGPSAGYGDTVWSKTHVSCLAYANPGWCAVSIVGNPNGQGILSNEIIFVNLNPGGRVYRMAHHRSAAGEDGGEGYWGEPHVVIDPTGTKAIFGSDLGKSIQAGGSVDTYLVEFP